MLKDAIELLLFRARRSIKREPSGQATVLPVDTVLGTAEK
jgi:hypothetical protein